MTTLDRGSGDAGGSLRIVHLYDIAWVGSAMVDALCQAGVDAELLTPARPRAGGPVTMRALLAPARLLALARCAVRAQSRRPDVVHVHYARHGWVAPLIRRPYVLHCHGTDVRDTPPGSGWGRVVAPAMRNAAAVLYATPDLVDAVASYRDDAEFIPNPIPVLDPAGPDTATTDVLLGVRLDPVKGATKVEAVMAELLRIRPRTTVTLVDIGARAGRLRRILGAAATVVAPVPHAVMPRILASHRVAVGQMLVGALGNYELEAMAAGLPTAARFRYPGAYPEPPPVIDDDNPAGMAAELAALLDDPKALAARGAASRRWVMTHHDPASIADRLLALYADVLGRPRAA